MINAISGLPAIVVDTFRELQAEIEKNSTETLKDSDKIIIARRDAADEAEKNTSAGLTVPEAPKYEQIAEKLQSVLKDNDLTLEFSKDKDTNSMILKIIDTSTKEVIRQLPPELTLKIAKIVANMMSTGSVTNARV